MIKKLRTVRSYVLRESRLTPAQQKAIDDYMSIWGIALDSENFNFSDMFKNNNDVVFEIGFGMGKSLIEQGLKMPNTNFLGVEIHKPGIGACLADIAENQLLNIRVLREDVNDVLPKIPPKSLQKIQIFFPDPWPKTRHHKRRLIQVPFITSLCEKLREGGELHVATDWENYANYILRVLNEISVLKNTSPENNYINKPKERPITKFEIRGKKLGHGVWDVLHKKCSKLK